MRDGRSGNFGWAVASRKSAVGMTFLGSPVTGAIVGGGRNFAHALRKPRRSGSAAGSAREASFIDDASAACQGETTMGNFQPKAALQAYLAFAVKKS